jgi:hypothetical protein
LLPLFSWHESRPMRAKVNGLRLAACRGGI